MGDQIYLWRQQLAPLGVANKEKKVMCEGMEKVFDSTKLYNALTSKAYLMNYVPDFLKQSALNPWAYGHKMMTFPKKPFHELIKEE